MTPSEILNTLQPPVSFHRCFVDLCDIGVPGAILLTQCLGWQKMKSNGSRIGWFYKTIDEWKRETGLGRFQIESARDKLEQSGILEHKLFDVPAKAYYRINLARLSIMLSGLSSSQEGNPSLLENSKLDCCKPANKFAGNLQGSGSTSRNYDQGKIEKKKKASPICQPANECILSNQRLTEIRELKGISNLEYDQYQSDWIKTNTEKGWNRLRDQEKAFITYMQTCIKRAPYKNKERKKLRGELNWDELQT